MIVLIYGAQTDKVRSVSQKTVESLKKKRPDAGFFRMDDESFDEAQFEELIFGQGLFDKKFIVHLDRVMEDKNVREYILKKLKELADSENAFVVTEYKLVKPTLEKLKKVAIKTEEFDAKKVESVQEFNIFALADAIGKKDKKNLWILYTQALKKDVAPEQIHGTLFNQVKNMLLIKKADEQNVGVGGLGIHPFVLKKATGFARNFSKEELETYSRALFTIYHDARGGGDELDIGLERFILSL